MQLLAYIPTNETTKIRFHALEMIFNIYSDVSYLSESGARIRACEHFFVGWMPKDNELIKLNSTFHTNSTIMRFVVASAAEAELGVLFHNCQMGIIFQQTLDDLGHPRPKIPMHCRAKRNEND